MMTHEKFNILCWGWILLALLLFPILLTVTQPYGKHTKRNWGRLINNKPGWFLMELPALLIVAYFIFFETESKSSLVFVAFSLWGLHYIHRSLIFPFRIKTKGKKMPVIIMVFAIIFNTINGFFNGYWLANFAPEKTEGMFSFLHLLVGTIVFLAGFIINQYHDWILIHLRKKSEKGYKIPYGGLFKFVSCPNFFGEIIIWLGFFIVTLSLPALSFLIWTIVNLTTRALDHHKWYLKEFSDYPKKRKAIIPHIL